MNGVQVASLIVRYMQRATAFALKYFLRLFRTYLSRYT